MIENCDWQNLLKQQYYIDIVKNSDHLQKNKGSPKVRGPRPKRSAWNVHKFGGSTFENYNSYSFVASLINDFEGKNLIVVSALYGVTNLLYSVCNRARQTPEWHKSEEWIKLVTRISSTIKGKLGDTHAFNKEIQRFAADLLYLEGVLSRMKDSSSEDQESIEQTVVGFGEIWSARLLTQTMRDDFKRAAAFLDAREVLVVDQQGPKINVAWDVAKEKLKNWFYHCRWCDVLIVTGFIARSLDGMPITLKRNGSDFSATIFSVLTKANSVTIWKDVDGMYSADPKKYPDAKFIPYQTFEDAEEASRRGAFVIQADCIEPAKMYNIPIYLRNCFKLSCPGTRIGSPEPTLTPPVEKVEDSSSNQPVDHLMDSIESDPIRSPSEPIYALCSDDQFVARRRSSSSHEHIEMIIV